MNHETANNNTETTPDYVQWFRHSSPYINAHRGKTFVLMLPGEAVRHDNFSNIIHDIALLHSLGVKLVLVHGARPQIEAQLQEMGTQSTFQGHLRVTQAEDLQKISHAIGEVRTLLEAALSTGLPNSPMHGAHLQVISGNFITGMPYGVINGVDLQHTGKVRRIDSSTLNKVLDADAVALLSPLGYSPTGEIFNLSCAEVATQVASTLDADKLISFINTEGAFSDQGDLLRQLTLNECEQHLQSLSPDSENYQALKACYQACLQGVSRSQLVSYTMDGALLTELFTRDGSGTMIQAEDYEQLRTATIDDVGGVLELLEPLENEGVLVRRSRELLETEIARFSVMEKDGTVIACAALYPFDNADNTEKTAELAAITTHAEYRKGGRAAQLLQQLEQQAIKQGIEKLFVLTTQTAHWFLEQGFIAGELEQLPKEKQALYNFQRNSKVFVKKL